MRLARLVDEFVLPDETEPAMSAPPDHAVPAQGEALSALNIASAVQGGKISAVAITEQALARIERHDGVLNSFTDVTATRARARARAIDSVIAAGKNAGPLAGVPFAVKNLFDVEGPADARRLEDQPRASAGGARRSR